MSRPYQSVHGLGYVLSKEALRRFGGNPCPGPDIKPKSEMKTGYLEIETINKSYLSRTLTTDPLNPLH